MDNLGISVDNWGLYVHIPFCETRCWYCDFYLETGWSPEVLRRFSDKILEELDQRLEFLGEVSFQTVYFGGGTPSILPPEVFLNLMEGLRTRGVNASQVELEANPESTDLKRLEAWSRAGVTRLSLGIQSLRDPQLKLLGRGAKTKEVFSALEGLQKNWPGSWSADLITGIPTQKPEELVEDLAKILEYGPQHLSLYSLSVESGTGLDSLTKRGRFVPLNEERHGVLFEAGAEYLVQRGFRHYEVSNFALPGQESLHNAQYWRGRPYLGLGPGAHSTLKTREGVLRTVNPGLFPYLATESENLVREMEALDTPTLTYERLMTGLRTSEGVSLEDLQTEFGWSGPEKGDQFWYDLAEEGWFEAPALPQKLVVPSPRRQVLHSLLVQLLDLFPSLVKKTSVR